MERFEARFVTTLDAGTHLLPAYVASLYLWLVMAAKSTSSYAYQSPSRLWHLLDVLNRFLKSGVAKRYLGDPHGT
jgi:hypothetical protein